MFRKGKKQSACLCLFSSNSYSITKKCMSRNMLAFCLYHIHTYLVSLQNFIHIHINVYNLCWSFYPSNIYLLSMRIWWLSFRLFSTSTYLSWQKVNTIFSQTEGNSACKMTPLYNLQFSRNYLYIMCLTLPAIIRWPSIFQMMNYKEMFVLYIGKYSVSCNSEHW